MAVDRYDIGSGSACLPIGIVQTCAGARIHNCYLLHCQYFLQKKTTVCHCTEWPLLCWSNLGCVSRHELVRYDNDIVGKTHASPFLIAVVAVLVVLLRRWVGRAATFVALVAAMLLVAYVNSKNWTALTERILEVLVLHVVLVLISRYLGSNAK